MESRGRQPLPESRSPSPCPVCRGEGVERRWRYDDRTSVQEEVSRACSYCGGSGQSPPRVDLRPGEPASPWGWDLGALL